LGIKLRPGKEEGRIGVFGNEIYRAKAISSYKALVHLEGSLENQKIKLKNLHRPRGFSFDGRKLIVMKGNRGTCEKEKL